MDREWQHQKQYVYRVAKGRLRMAARRALKWIGCIFRYEVFPQVSRGETIHITLIFNEIQSFKTDVNQS